jgi:hypothetical protein
MSGISTNQGLGLLKSGCAMFRQLEEGNEEAPGKRASYFA